MMPPPDVQKAIDNCRDFFPDPEHTGRQCIDFENMPVACVRDLFAIAAWADRNLAAIESAGPPAAERYPQLTTNGQDMRLYLHDREYEYLINVIGGDHTEEFVRRTNMAIAAAIESAAREAAERAGGKERERIRGELLRFPMPPEASDLHSQQMIALFVSQFVAAIRSHSGHSSPPAPTPDPSPGDAGQT